MHELHNPGGAAKRAAAQMRENLLRLQQLSLRNATQALTPGASGLHAPVAGADAGELPSSRP